MNPKIPELTYPPTPTFRLTSHPEGKPLKRFVTVQYPLLTRRERRQMVRDAKKAGKRNGIQS